MHQRLIQPPKVLTVPAHSRHREAALGLPRASTAKGRDLCCWIASGRATLAVAMTENGRYEPAPRTC